MTRYSVLITIGASPVNFAVAAFAANAVPGGGSNLFSSSYLPACRVTTQLKSGSTGPVYVGSASVTSTGVNASFEMLVAGDEQEIVSQTDSNAVDLSQFNAHGATTGDKVLLTYYQI